MVGDVWGQGACGTHLYILSLSSLTGDLDSYNSPLVSGEHPSSLSVPQGKLIVPPAEPKMTKSGHCRR